jgi:hypothetical protein
MSKKIIFLVSSTPDNPALGYGDHWEVRNNNTCIDGGHGSTCPNPWKTNEQGHPIPWTLRYGWIAPGTFSFKCITHYKYGKCILINNGLSVPSRVKNYGHRGEMILSEIFIHTGSLNSFNPKWRGSRGCLTIAPDEWDRFIDLFELEETGELDIRDILQG